MWSVPGLSPLLSRGQLVVCVQAHLQELLAAHLVRSSRVHPQLRQQHLMQLLALCRTVQQLELQSAAAAASPALPKVAGSGGGWLQLLNRARIAGIP